jgi:double-strand break repair protein MRE11
LHSWVKKLLKETRNEILKKGYEPSKEGPEHDDLGNEMRAAKDAAEAKYGGKVCLPLPLVGRC